MQVGKRVLASFYDDPGINITALQENLTNWSILNGAKRPVEAESRPQGAQITIDHLEQHIGAQTNIAGDAKGPVASEQFDSAATFGEGDAKDCRQGDASEKDDDGG